MRKTVLFAAAVVLSLGLQGAAADDTHHVKSTLVSAEGSKVTGHVSLVSLPHGGTLITIVATGLQPGGSYISLYYDNHVCEIEPYSQDDIVGTYTATKAGLGTTSSMVTDDLDEINSVSVRNAEDFTLLACANVH